MKRDRVFDGIVLVFLLLALLGAFCAGVVGASLLGMNPYIGASIVMGGFLLLIVWGATREAA